jgi:hypothetical protein
LSIVVVGRDPADEDPVVASKLLARKDRVAADGAAELFVDREVAQKLIRRGAVQRRTVDELPSQICMGAEVQKAERGQRRRRVDAAADEVPENVDELVVVKALAVEFEPAQEARQVIRWIGPPESPRISAGRRSSRGLRRSLCCTRRRRRRP